MINSPPIFRLPIAAVLQMFLLFSVSLSSLAVEIREIDYQGRAHFLIKTASCVWYYDRAGGGFSRLIDRDGRDWIGFNKTPLAEYPASAAAGYRGIPNAVFVGPDKGAGHPGFDQCESQVAKNVIRTKTKSGSWEWTWTFSEFGAVFEMLRAGNDPWWFLYEGLIAGTYDPQHKIWGTDRLGLQSQQPSNKNQFFGNWQTLYVADRRVPRILSIHQHTSDDLPDNYWYLGSSNGGNIDSKDGMVVMGFGRGPGTKPQLSGSKVGFTVGLIDLEQGEPFDHESIMRDIAHLQEQVSSTDGSNTEQSEPKIEFWHGPKLVFGEPGLTQKWINVLGRVSFTGEVDAAVYRVDDGPEQPLTLGTDLHRLARTGDFNIELAAEELEPGPHAVEVIVKTKSGLAASLTAEIELNPQRHTWPLPYEVDFSETRFADGGMAEVQKSAQIIDGLWRIEKSGLRTAEPWYDRVAGFGDTSWKNYEALVTLTVHGFTPPQIGPPTYNVSHCALALRWTGHTADGKQPSRQWYPMGCQGELLLRNDLSNCQWRALPGSGRGSKPVYAETATAVALDVPICMKARVESTGDGQSLYSFKHWRLNTEEPSEWYVQQREPTATDNASGSLLIVPHNSDITIHRVSVDPL